MPQAGLSIPSRAPAHTSSSPLSPQLDDSVESFMDSDTPESTSGKQQHFYIFCDVGIGRPYIIDGSSQRLKPEGYDSLYLSKKPLDRDDDGVISAEEYEAAVGEGTSE